MILIVVVSLTQLSLNDVIADEIVKIDHLFNVKCNYQNDEKHSFFLELDDKL